MTTAVTKTATSFDALLSDLATMAKAVDVNEDEIKEGRAAEKHMEGKGDGMTKSEAEKKKEEEEEEEKRKKEGKGKGKTGEMAKSFSLKTEAGDTIEVMDGTEMLKALGVRLDTSEATILATLNGCADVIRAQGSLLKSMSDKVLGQDATITAQADLIKSLQADVTKLGTAPAGRRAVLAVTERETGTATKTMAKSGIPEGVTSDAFFAKAFALQGNGKLTGADISLAETCLNNGMAIPEALVNRVLAN